MPAYHQLDSLLIQNYKVNYDLIHYRLWTLGHSKAESKAETEFPSYNFVLAFDLIVKSSFPSIPSLLVMLCMGHKKASLPYVLGGRWGWEKATL